jgi:hypothetical protein
VQVSPFYGSTRDLGQSRFRKIQTSFQVEKHATTRDHTIVEWDPLLSILGEQLCNQLPEDLQLMLALVVVRIRDAKLCFNVL